MKASEHLQGNSFVQNTYGQPRRSTQMDVEKQMFLDFLHTAPDPSHYLLALRLVGEDEHGGGYGVFAAEAIPQGSIVCYYAGSFVPHSFLSRDDMTHAILGGWTDQPGQVIDGRIYKACMGNAPVWAAGAMINSTMRDKEEACEANVEVDKCSHAEPVVDRTTGGAFYHHIVKIVMGRPYGYAMTSVRSTRAIAAGEQLVYFYDYSSAQDEQNGKVAMINDTDTQKVAKKRRVVATRLS